MTSTDALAGPTIDDAMLKSNEQSRLGRQWGLEGRRCLFEG